MSDYKCKVRIIRDMKITVYAKNKNEAEKEAKNLCKLGCGLPLGEYTEVFAIERMTAKKIAQERVVQMANEIKCGLLKNATRCKKCSSVNIELEHDIDGYYVKCEDCGYYVAGDNSKDALKNWERGSDGTKND